MWKNGRNDSRKIKRKTKKEDNVTERYVGKDKITHQHTHTLCCFLPRKGEKEDTVGERS